MKIALVHDYLREWGGAEEVLQALHQLWPQAPIFTAYVTDKQFVDRLQTGRGGEYSGKTVIKQTWMRFIPRKNFKNITTPLLPLAFKQFSFKDYDVVISSSASFAKAVVVTKPTVHICYCHTTPRFLYDLQRERARSVVLDVLEKPVDAWLKKVDQDAAKRVDYFIANSTVVAKRIKKNYGVDATIIHPPVDAKKFCVPTAASRASDESKSAQERSSWLDQDDGSDAQTRRDDGGSSNLASSNRPESRSHLDLRRKSYFVTIGRLSAIKHFELAIMACNKLAIPLKVVGSGTSERYLQSIAGPTIEFLGRLDDEEIAQLLLGAKAVISTVQDEDFGMLPLEVVGAGVPVIAFASEASHETLASGVTGEFFTEPTAESLQTVLEHFDETKYNPEQLIKHAQSFSKERFMEKMQSFVERTVNSSQKDN